MAQSEDLIQLPELISESGLKLDGTETVDGASNDDGYVYCIVLSVKVEGRLVISKWEQPQIQTKD